MENQLFDKELQDQPWRKYSPDGKRKRMTNIPFGGKISKLKAQGTKVVPVVSSFSYMAEFALVQPTRVKGSKKQTNYLPFNDYTAEQRANMTPEELRIAAEKQKRQDSEIRRKDDSSRRSGYRTILDTVGEVRGGSRELREWNRALKFI